MDTEPLKLVICIVNRGIGEHVVKLCAEEGIDFRIILRGHGTADSETLNLLGIGDKEKDIVLLSVKASNSDEIMKRLTRELELERAGRGIAFSIPFSAVASQLSSYALMAGNLADALPEKGVARVVKKLKGRRGRK